MKSRMLMSPLWKTGSWKNLFLCGKKSLKKPAVELPPEIIESEILPRLSATLELPQEIIEESSEILPRLSAMLELPHEIIEESEILPRLLATLELLPEIIEWEILPRLPAKSLRRFMRVCKQWKSLISTHEFARKNVQHLTNKQSLTCRKVLEIGYLSQTFSTRDCEDLNNHDSTTIRSIPFVNEAQEVLLLASLDGLVFVRLLNAGESALWNPLTGAYKKLPNSPNSCTLHSVFGFYYDSYKKDYKVVQVPCFGAFKAFVYSQRLNSWKEIQWLENRQRLSKSSWSTPISLGESLYFMGKRHNVTNRHQCWIIVFDMKSEKFREIYFPLLNQQYAYYCGSLMVIKGCIHIFVASNIQIQETGLKQVDGELWRMDGDGDGWTKVKNFPAHNHPLTLDEKTDMEDLARNFFDNLEYRTSTRKMLYLETLVSPSG